MSGATKTNFVRQQGFSKAEPSSCDLQFSALMFQPRVVGLFVAIGLVTQSSVLFLTLSALLLWNALLPKLNPFDALYNTLVARPRALAPLDPAPAPRRFAQTLAATFMLGIGIALRAGSVTAAWVLEVLLVGALAALIFGRFCVGSYLYHVVTGNAAFASRTLPWKRSQENP